MRRQLGRRNGYLDIREGFGAVGWETARTVERIIPRLMGWWPAARRKVTRKKGDASHLGVEGPSGVVVTPNWGVEKAG